MVAFGAVVYVLVPLILVTAVGQFAFHLWSGSRNERVDELANALTALLQAIFDFLLYRTDLLPYPFNPLPIPTDPDDFGSGPGLAGVQPAGGEARAGWEQCLAHLGRHQTGGPPERTIADAIRTDQTEVLVGLEIRPWTLHGEAHLAIAVRNAALDAVFVGTRWQGRAWLAALKSMPGAVTGRIRIIPDSNPRHALLIPLDRVLGALDR